MLPGLSFLLLLAGAAPCGPLDLDTAVSLALERSDEVRIGRAEAASAGADEALARALRILPEASATLVAGPSPEARGTVTSSPDSNRSLAHLGPFGRLDVQAVQPLYTWGRLDAAGAAAAAGRRAREELVSDVEGKLRLRVVQLYGAVALSRRLQALADDVEKALGRARVHVEEALASGSGEVLLGDKYRVELFTSLVGFRAAEARRAEALARIGLAATLGIPTEGLALQGDPLPAGAGDPPDVGQAREAAARQRHDLQALDQALKAREAEVAAEQAAQKPQLFAAGVLSLGYAPNRDQQRNPWVRDEFNAFTVGAVIGLRQDLAVPLRSARADKAAAERETLLAQRQGLLRLVGVEVEGAAADVASARARLLAAQAGQESGRALFRSSGLDFSAGLLEARALIEAYGLYVESQVGAAQAAYDLLVARARLAQVTAAPLPKGTTCSLP